LNLTFSTCFHFTLETSLPIFIHTLTFSSAAASKDLDKSYIVATQLLQSLCPDREMAVCAPVMSTMASVLTYDVVDTPMGPFTLGASDFAIHSAYFGKPSSVPAAGSDDHHQRYPVLALV
jgi:hypothetical protein